MIIDKINVCVYYFFLMKVIEEGNIAVYVYNEVGQPHKMPHCHVRNPDSETVVALPSLTVIVGAPLSKSVRELLLATFEELCNCWDELNPEEKT